MNQNKLLYVKNNQVLVGTLALTKDKKIAFQYSDEWLETGFSINPFSLPLNKNVFIADKNIFDGLFGVFADSLPDSWGNLLLERFLKSKNLQIQDLNVLDRLAIIGKNGMGALSYEPAIKYEFAISDLSLDEINIACGELFNKKNEKNLDDLFRLGGSSGGARPKVMLKINNIDWIIKFSNHIDSKEAGIIEYEYFKCAQECGIVVPNVKLFPSNLTKGYFGIERFDRCKNERIHMITVAGLLEVDFRSPCLDYNDLLKLTNILTNGVDTFEMFKRMCFNVFAHNLDDHAKNFSFIYDSKLKRYKLSPAYDLTYSNTFFGEHTTSVNGKGKDITDEDLLQVAINNNLSKEKCKDIISKIKECVKLRLSKFFK